ncbi:MAG: DUF2934 domain-containing protein [Vicinamibacterales bacterium]
MKSPIDRVNSTAGTTSPATKSPPKRSARKTTGAATLESASSAPGGSADQIRARAYELYQERGGSHGRDLDDWLIAEREVSAGPAKPPARRSRPAKSNGKA